MRFFSTFCLTVTILSSTATAQQEQMNPSLAKTVVLDVGVAFQNLDGEAGAVTSSGKGGTYDFSRLGLDEEDRSLQLGLRWRLGDSWHLDLGFEETDTAGEIGNSNDLDFGHITIPKGYQINSELTVRTYSAFLGYALSKDHVHEAGARLGVNVLDLNASVTGRTWLGNASIAVGPQNLSTTSTVPTIGLFGILAITDRLTLEGTIDWIAGSLGAYSGHYLAAETSLTFWLTNQLSVSGGYRFLDAELEWDGGNLDSTVDVRSSGAFIRTSIGY